jgi:flagellar L-ring protein FlgH
MMPQTNQVVAQRSHWNTGVCCFLSLILLLLSPGSTFARKKKKQKQETFQQSLLEYERQAQEGVANTGYTTGSIWNPAGPLAELARDDKAYRVGDILNIDVIEQTSSAATGNVKTSRSFSASSGISALMGEIGSSAGLANLFSPTSNRALNGQAQTSDSYQFSTNLAATVVDVLPNRYLVVQATRSVEVDNEQQQVVVRGICRPTDIQPGNVIPSTSLADLSVQVIGKGIITDETAPPNKLIRFILKIVGF